MSSLSKILRPIKNRIMMLLGRALVSAINDSNQTQLLQLKLLADEVATDVERFEDYGLASYPLVDAQALACFINGNRHHGVVICVHDRRYRPSYLSSGEVAIYTNNDKNGDGHRIHLQSDGNINMKGADLDGDFTGSLDLRMQGASREECSGTMQKIGNIIVIQGTVVAISGSVTLGGAVGTGKQLATEDIISIFNNHVHSGIQAGGSDSGVPTTTMSTAQFSTTKAN